MITMELDQSFLTSAFWASAGCLLYVYVGYPLVLLILGSISRPGMQRDSARPRPRSVSVIVVARDEATRIERRVRELDLMLQRLPIPGELIVVSDGSSDGTVQLAQSSGRAIVIELRDNVGKAAAMSVASRKAGGEILVFADARQRWAPDALCRLVENFTDPSVGAVSGRLVIESSDGTVAGVGLYWRYETWVRRLESRVWSLAGVTGAICAVRRELFRPIPRGTILDDVYWPLCVAMRGWRVVHDDSAQAFDVLPTRARAEFRRKVRTLSGNFQLIARVPRVLLPARNPVWLQFASHKLMRLLVPWLLAAMLALAWLLRDDGYRGLLWAQLAFYAIGAAGAMKFVGRRFRVASAVCSFLMLNAAAWVAFWVWISGRASGAWNKTLYEPASS
jgi:cellulose synthase/poly-beta-1,6-N-acetylglucosamine synthase-like glycosyltransferase